MDKTSNNKVILDLTKVSYWTKEEGYEEYYLEDTGILPELDDDDTVEHMIFMHSELHNLSYNVVKEVGTPYIEQALISAYPTYKVWRISDLLSETLGFDIERGIDIKDDGRKNGVEITYTDEAVKKLQELYSEFEDYDLSDMTMQALADGVKGARTSYDGIIDLAWGHINEAFDKEIEKAVAEEDEW
mgnify:FL=1